MATKYVRVSNPNTKELVVIEDYCLTSKGSIFKNWDLSPEYCMCEVRCQCGNINKMSEEQLKLLEAHVKQVRASRKATSKIG